MSCKLSWGVDGYGHRHYMCDQCQIYLGVMSNGQSQNIQTLIDHGAKCDQFGLPIKKGKVQNENLSQT